MPRSLRRLLPAALAATVLALAAAGCGSTEKETPIACLEGAGGYERALAAAPGDVLLAGETPISDCLIRNQPAGEMSRIGLAALRAATALNAEAEDGADREAAALRAGYLVGALAEGAERTDGIHATLVDRARIAASNHIAAWDAAVRRAYRRGLAAGAEHG